MIRPHILERGTIKQIPSEIRSRITLLTKTQDVEASTSTEEATPRASKGRCYLCTRQRNRTTRRYCKKCYKWICPDHSYDICGNCL
ncbi:hypothetical protein QE152_g22672 [Popillia japonica]|uniref:PiggyBac transposable element-derived protein 4 C-terminal zinc-ribbon domain-containing protein n=1 Tax=Popillia japonica TaxID=7064 RepID=A0AAW1KKT3_POPJA